jgi:hypothetical protein
MFINEQAVEGVQAVAGVQAVCGFSGSQDCHNDCAAGFAEPTSSLDGKSVF